MRKTLTGAATALAEPAGAALRVTGKVLPGLLGLGLVSYGAWLACPPAGFITAGVLLLVDRAWTRTRGAR